MAKARRMARSGQLGQDPLHDRGADVVEGVALQPAGQARGMAVERR
jgi:hypothetical protein